MKVFLVTLLTGFVASSQVIAEPNTNANLCDEARIAEIAKDIRSLSVWDVIVKEVQLKESKEIGGVPTKLYNIVFDMGNAELRLDEYCQILEYKLDYE